MTSAPCSARSSTPSGPAMPHERSRMRMPSSAPAMGRSASRTADACVRRSDPRSLRTADRQDCTSRAESTGGPMRRMAMTVAVVALALGWASPGVAGGAPNTPRKPFDVQVQRDFVYRTVGGDEMKLDAYLPGGTGTGPLPGVVVLFGGGWVLGSKELSEPLARALAEQGFAAFAVDYRLAPAHPFPAAIDDVQASVKWLREHAIEFNLDPDHIGAIGGSAGGHLSALASTLGDGPHDRGSRLAAAVSWAGPMDLHPDEYGPDSQFYLDAFLDCPTGQCKESTIEAASPISHVDRSDGAMFLANGQEDVLVPPDQAERM